MTGAGRQGSVLIFRLGSIGDTIVALPCFHAIARDYPNHRRVLLTNSPTSRRASSAESVLDGTGSIDEVIYYPVGDFSLRRALLLMRQIKRVRPTVLVYLAERSSAWPVIRDLAFFKAAGVRTIVGLPWRSQLRSNKVDAVTRELEPEAERLARLLDGFVTVSLSPDNWDLKLSVTEVETANRALGFAAPVDAMLAIAPGAKIAPKDWGSDNWASLLKSQATRYAHMGLVMIGADDERTLCEGLAQHWAGPVFNLCGSLTPRETAAVLRRCRLLICHDSGPMHLAATQNTPCLALFGNYNLPRKWFPYGGGHRTVYEPRGVREITVERVAKELLSALTPRS